MYIELECDYDADDNKGLYVHFIMEDDDQDDGYLALVRIEDNGMILWYESQNGEYICNAEGEYMTEKNIKLVREFLKRQFPNCVIDTGGLI